MHFMVFNFNLKLKQEVLNKYSVYVHLLPEWNSDSKNLIFDVTNLLGINLINYKHW